LDIDPSMIAATENRSRENDVENIVAIERDFLAEGTGRPDSSVGYAMLFNILHIEEPTKLLAEAFRVLVPGGRLSVIHWMHDPQTPRGPALEIRPTPQQCRDWAEAVGFQFVRDEDLCCCAWHWGMVMEKGA
jgi:ubiquinone/menaquinone biosynthesis C-methylase UbiE